MYTFEITCGIVNQVGKLQYRIGLLFMELIEILRIRLALLLCQLPYTTHTLEKTPFHISGCTGMACDVVQVNKHQFMPS